MVYMRYCATFCVFKMREGSMMRRRRETERKASGERMRRYWWVGSQLQAFLPVNTVRVLCVGGMILRAS